MKETYFGMNILLDYMTSENANPDEIKEQIIETFKKYFINYDNLVKYSMEYLILDWISYSQLRSQK